jgi:TonB family protein
MQFAHFGVLDAGRQNKPTVVLSMVVNAIFVFVLIVISAANSKMIEQRILLTELTFQPAPKLEPIKPKIVPPAPKPPPVRPRLEVLAPKIAVVKPLDIPKPPDVKMDTPKPVIAPPAPVKVIPVPAAQAVNLAKPQPAALVNRDLHPAAVNLGSANAPTLHGPAVADVNLGRGLNGAAGSGSGPSSTKVNLGNGSAGGSIHGTGLAAVTGIPHGVPGGTGTAAVATQVNLGQVVAPQSMPKAAAAVAPLQRTEPRVIYKPKPEYTEEARQLHIEGTITLRIRVFPNGSVMVLSVVNDLGHGLADSAKRAILATKFQPATDTTGQPITWDGVVYVAFQLAG